MEAATEESIAPKLVIIDVAPDRASAVKKITAAYDSRAEYVKSTLDQYKRMLQQTDAAIKTANDALFYPQLLRLQEAVGVLELLTPRLVDGSMDSPGARSRPRSAK